MNQDGFDSPELAAMSTFPAKHVYVVAARKKGDDAYVLLNTGSRDQPYLYGVNCGRKAGRWYERGSANGPGWEQTAHTPDVGTLSMWGDAPLDSTRVRLEFNDQIIEEAVTDRAYLAVWWRVPCPSAWPCVVGFW